MPQERYAKWDTMKLPYGFNEAYIEPPKTVEGERARRRVAPYEEYLESVKEGVFDERHAQLLRSLVRETLRRCSRWGVPGVQDHRGLPLPKDVQGRGVNWTRVISYVMLVVCSLCLYFGHTVAAAIALVVWVKLVLIASPAAWWLRRRNVLRARLAEGACVDCGYDLRETVPAIASKDLDGLWIGPRACPECGAPWPMLPPPVFDG